MNNLLQATRMLTAGAKIDANASAKKVFYILQRLNHLN